MNYGSFYSTAAVSTTTVTASSTALAANAARIGYFIQNLGTNALYVGEGMVATTSNYTYVLKAGSGNDDGSGGSSSKTSGIVYNGIITIAGTSPRYTVTEYAP